MSEHEEVIRVLKEELMQSYLNAGNKQREAIFELRKFRTQTPVVTITLLTAVTAIAHDDIDLSIMFFVAYILLFLSTISGLIGTEGVLRSDIYNFQNYQSHVQSVMKQLKDDKDAISAIGKFVQYKKNSWQENLFSYLSEWSITSFVIGLILLFISIFPYPS